VIKEIKVLFSAINNTIEPQDLISDSFDFTAVSESEYFTDRTTKTVTLNLQSLGGMAIPMGIPMNMSVSPVGLSTDLSNAGNAAAYPLVTVTGPFASGFNLINDTTGLTFTYTGALLITDHVDIDFYNRTAIKNDVTNILSAVSGSWLTLDPGSNVTRLTGGGADTGNAAVTYHDTYRNI
jgi:phage-related protein